MGGMATSVSPWDLRDQVVSLPESSGPDIAAACSRLDATAQAWADDPGHRARRLQDFGSILAERRADIVALLVREAGKVESDAQAEADLLLKKITITLGVGVARTPQRPPPAPHQGEPFTIWRPRGLAAVLGPFNFPLHLLHGLVVPALAVGATVLAKPSERCPALGALYGECLEAAGLGSVCAVMTGGAAIAQAFTRLPALATLAAVGGRAMGAALARSLADRPEVVLALELGGVNHAIVLEDADLVAAAQALADGAWRMAGQRCTATRVVHVPEGRRAELTALLMAQQQRYRPDGSAQGMIGPLITRAAADRMREVYGRLPAGLSLLAGALMPRSTHCACVEPLLLELSAADARQHPLYAEEQFVPALIVDSYRDADECVSRMARNPYRLSAAIFTASPARFLAYAARLPYGVVNHNRPTAGARSDQPFGGLGKSGNGRPAGVAAGAIFADESVVWPAG